MSSINILKRDGFGKQGSHLERQPFGKPARSTADALGTAVATSLTLHTILFFLNKTTFKPSLLLFLLLLLKDNSNLKQALLPVIPLRNKKMGFYLLYNEVVAHGSMRCN